MLAYQIAGDDGLKLMHADGKAEERNSPPAENTLTDLLSLPMKDGLGTLVLIDEVLLYAKVKCRTEPGWLDILTSFFQYLTQAAAKVERCCVVASLLSSEPKDQADSLGKKIVAELYDIFQRQREAAVQPVEKDDVAEVLRRRLFDPKSVNQRENWPQQVIAALRGVTALDEQTEKLGATANDRYLKSFPFHPELTEVFYAKWAAGIERFQKTRGVLRTFALALREAQAWDQSPLVGPAVFLSPPKQDGLSEAARRTRVDSRHDRQRWPGNAMDGHPGNRTGLCPAGPGRVRGPEAARDRAGGDGDVLALAAYRPQRQDPRSHVADRPLPGGQDRVGERAWAMGLAQLLARRHEPAGERGAVARRLALG